MPPRRQIASSTPPERSSARVPKPSRRAVDAPATNSSRSKSGGEHDSSKQFPVTVIHKNPLWGRSSTPAAFEIAFCATFLLLCPASFLIPWSILELGDGSIGKLLSKFSRSHLDVMTAILTSTIGDMHEVYRIVNLAQVSLPIVVEPMKLYGIWVVFQATLFVALPGTSRYGDTTPAGNRLLYKWTGLMVAASSYGTVLSVVAYVKAHVKPSHPSDRKFSGSLFHDFFAGIELNPRFGSLDLKLFNIGRVGMTAWTIYQKFGYISNSMILVNILQNLYIVDFFYQEGWYVRTFDIAHDHFGFYLAWGGAAWIPSMYTLQAQYLAHCPENLTRTETLIVALVGIFGYWMFRASNEQRTVARCTAGNCVIWRKKPVVITAHYTTSDGKPHTSLLLCSGFWGIARHFNYIADLVLSFAMCAACGARNDLPYAYFVQMVVLLVHRSIRDEHRCSKKYGKDWELYKARVPYVLIPGVY
ncbi:7-dehydrocholesterol reductase [Mycena sanguinolenta]|nr:7-dehydrocholesterol reductase [Mycena sanguinolenta]